MDLKYIFVLIGFVCVFEAQAATSELSRQKRDEGGVNIIQVFLKVQQLLESCKKSNPPEATNHTNPIVQFVESHDIQCLMDGFTKIVQEMFPSKQSSRQKRDTGSILMQFLQLQQDIQKCKKSDATPTNTTNIIEKIMNDYDIGCLAKTVMDFVKTISQSSSQGRSKRALQFSDITCFIMKLMNSQSKIEEIVNAFKPQEHSRAKRSASAEKMCEDFGSTMNSLLSLILDFAPNHSST